MSVDTVRNWCDKGTLPHWWTPGGQRMVREADVDALLVQASPNPEDAA